MADKRIQVSLIAEVGQYIAGMRAAGAATGDLASKGGASVSKLGDDLTKIGTKLSIGLTAPLAAAGAASGKMALDFQTAFQRMVGLAEVPANEVNRLRESVLSLAGETGRAPIELANALYEAASAGLDAQQAMDAVEMAARGAAAGLGSTQDIVGLVASATASYGAANISAAEAVDILTQTIREGRADPDELAASLGRVLPVAAQMGITFDQVGGSVAYLSNIFGDTAVTVTSFRAMLTTLLDPSKEGRDALQDMGTSVEELHAAIREDGLLGGLELLREHGFQGNTEALAALVPETRAQAAMFALLNDESGTLAETLGAVENSAGSMSEAFQGWLEGDGATIAQAWGEVQAAMVRAGEKILPIVAEIMDHVADLAEAFSNLPGPIQDAILILLGIGAAAGPIMTVTGHVLKLKAAILEANAAAAAGPLAGGGVSVGVPVGGPHPAVGPHTPGLERWLANQRGPVVPWPLPAMMFAEQVFNGPNRIRARQEMAERHGMGGPSVIDRMLGRVPSGSLSPEFVMQTLDPAMRSRLAAAQAGVGAVTAASATPPSAAALARMNALPSIRGPQPFGSIVNAEGAARMDAAFVDQVNAGIKEAAENFERAQKRAMEFNRVVNSAEWGQAGFEGATTALGAFNDMVFAAGRQTADMEGSMDALKDALDEVGTIGAKGLDDLNLKTEDGRKAFAALQEVAAAWEPRLAQAIDLADGNVGTLSESLGGIREDFIDMATDAGIGREEAENLANAIGLIPENAQTLIELSGAEEAKLKLDLMSGAIQLLDEKDQVEIALLMADNQFTEAAALAETKLTDLDNTTAIPEIRQSGAEEVQAQAEETETDIRGIPTWWSTDFQATDNASGTANAVGRAVRSVPTSWTTTFKTINEVVTKFTTLTDRGPITRFAQGGTVGPRGGLGGEAGPEFVEIGGMRAVINEPTFLPPGTVVTPFSAMGSLAGVGRGGGSSAAVSSSSRGGETYVGHADIKIGDETIARRVELKFRERDRAVAAGSRF